MKVAPAGGLPSPCAAERDRSVFSTECLSAKYLSGQWQFVTKKRTSPKPSVAGRQPIKERETDRHLPVSELLNCAVKGL
jgi:hypothetical protein